MQLLFTSSVEDDRCAFLEKAACCACSNARAGPRHNDNFFFESSHDFSDTEWAMLRQSAMRAARLRTLSSEGD
jgi:hypothetical protein